ncbi:MAG: UbiD family decarboxylase [Myxococcales bacterium FL481]|nr:MAG: UbiD family decarboxylase [Myxococcales bacterium FL481]
MAYASLRACVDDLERHGHLRRVATPVDPHLELAEIQRRLYAAEGPALLFERVKNSPFPAVCNLFGTVDRARFIFRHSLERVRRVLELKADPMAWRRQPSRYLTAPLTAVRALPRRVRSGPVLAGQTRIDQLPAIHSWPDDGGAFVTLPQVYSEDPARPGVHASNVGMYRIQLNGNAYQTNAEVGLHYQIHRGIGVHHSRARERGERLPVSVFVGGPPAHTLAAVMPLPEGLSELVFAGMLAGRRFRYATRGASTISTDADFCIVGSIDPTRTKPEGPFGDHLGYYSLTHDFPVLDVEAVYHRRDAIWPFTVVGRPPQEDTTFGALIHELTAPLVPHEIPGLLSMHAVDAAGVHPLLLAIGQERYVPYRRQGPQELLTIANAILGFGQASLAKYLLIVCGDDVPGLDVHDEARVLAAVLERVDWTRDLHFHTRTTIDTLDYSGAGLNEGSKLVIAAAGPARRRLASELPVLGTLPPGFSEARLALPGVLVVSAPKAAQADVLEQITPLLDYLRAQALGDSLPLVVLADDAKFAAANLRNFLWVTFTRSNPSHDVHGVDSFIANKHWGCHGSLVIDARRKAHHAPPLVEDPAVTARVDELAGPGGPLHGVL